MRLPPFLRFLEPLFASGDHERVTGHLLVELVRRDRAIEVIYDGPNYVVDLGLTSVRDLLLGVNGAGFAGSIFRMSIGDGGVPAGQLYSPKQPDGTWPARTALYHEVLRQDIAAFSKPTATSARFVGSFSSVNVDPTSYSLPDKVINEAALIVGDGVLTIGGAKKQVNKVPPDAVDADEKMVSTRTFKSAPFDPADAATITVTWTLNVIR